MYIGFVLIFGKNYEKVRLKTLSKEINSLSFIFFSWASLENSLGIQVWNSKIDFNMETLSISCRNKHWSQYFNQILFSSTGYLTICPAVVVQAVLDSRAACTSMARQILWSVLISAAYAECLDIKINFWISRNLRQLD